MQLTSAGGIGLTTEQMMQQALFMNWDFSTEDGDSAEWMMLRENEDYPRLAWQQVIAGDIAGMYGVDAVDLIVLSEQWLMPATLSSNFTNPQDRMVNLKDWAVFAAAWGSSEGQIHWAAACDIAPDDGDGKIDEQDVLVIADQWLLTEAWSADIIQTSPDSVVNIDDFTVLAVNWLRGVD